MTKEELYRETRSLLNYIIKRYESDEAVFIKMDKLANEVDKSDLNFIVIYQHVINEVYTKLQDIKENQHFGERCDD